MTQTSTSRKTKTGTVSVSGRIGRDVKRVSRKYNIPEDQVVNNAIRYYLRTLDEEKELRDELALWDRAGAEDFSEFEHRL